MSSIFDSAEFNARLFFARPDRSPCPARARDRALAMRDNATLHARVHPCANARAAVLLFHGNGEVVADYDSIATLFHQAGFSLAVVDFRGYGQSTGTPTLRACIEDAPHVARALRDELTQGRALPLIVFGRSLGGHCAAEIAGTLPALCDAIILESAGSDLFALLARRGIQRTEPLTEEERLAFDPSTKLRRCALPSLVLHGAIDTLIAPREAQQNFAALGTEQKRLVLIEGRGHNDLSLSPSYWNAIASVL